ncbi:MAG: hypothetical protein RIS70_3795 [Planctomycetota bacterium]
MEDSRDRHDQYFGGRLDSLLENSSTGTHIAGNTRSTLILLVNARERKLPCKAPPFYPRLPCIGKEERPQFRSG